MSQNTQKEQLFHVYEQLFKYKDMLKNAPALTIDVSQSSPEQLDSQEETIRQQLRDVVGYLLGLNSNSMSVVQMVTALNEHYKEDDFWRLLLLDYIDVCQQEDEAALAKEKEEVKQQGNSLYQRILSYQRQRKEIIQSFAKKLAKKNFPIDGERLFRNYLNMADIDSKEAWAMITTNPAAFAPIIVENEKGARIISISSAKSINKKIGAFIKSMKA